MKRIAFIFAALVVAVVSLSSPAGAQGPTPKPNPSLVPGIGPRTLATPTPAPTAPSSLTVNGNANLGLVPLGQPKNVAMATSGPQCAQHMNLDSQIAQCDPAIAAKKLVLVWNYAQGALPDGFNIFRNGNLSATQNVDPKQTAYVMAGNLDDAAGDCYTVQAYTKSPAATGPKSAAFCVPATPTSKTLSAQYSNPSFSIDTTGSQGCGGGFYTANVNSGDPCNPGNPIPPASPLLVGYQHSFNSGGCAKNVSYAQFRSGLSFNLNGISATNLVKATLTMNVSHAWTDTYAGDEANLPTNGQGNYIFPEKQSDESCLRAIGYAINSDWMHAVNKSSLYGYDPALTVGGANGAISVDVTSMVKTWLAGSRPNNGFILIGPSQGGVNNDECLTSYHQPQLILKYSQ